MLIKRTDSSSYFRDDFLDIEKKRIESISGYLYYSPQETLPDEGEIILITNTHTKLAAWEPFKSRVKLIIHPNSGFDNLSATSWTCPILLGNEIRAQAVAQWSLAALMQETCFIRSFSKWPAHRFFERSLLRDRKILIIGHGHVGSILKSHLPMAHIYDPFQSLEVDLKQAWDVVILACSLNPKNKGMIDRDFLAHCSKELLLINPARGELVVKKDLESFLDQNPKARAYLDVHEKEPFELGFYQTSQIIATPHIAGVWDGLLDAMIDFEVKAIEAYKNQKIPADWLLQSRLTDQGYYR